MEAQMAGVPPLIYGNQEFFQNMVDYMMGDNSVLDLRSKQIDIHAIDKEKVQVDAGFYKVLNMILPSSIILAFAGLMLFLRKRKYTKN
jgi:ABC-2 type transport system permease protein